MAAPPHHIYTQPRSSPLHKLCHYWRKLLWLLHLPHKRAANRCKKLLDERIPARHPFALREQASPRISSWPIQIVWFCGWRFIKIWQLFWRMQYFSLSFLLFPVRTCVLSVLPSVLCLVFISARATCIKACARSRKLAFRSSSIVIVTDFSRLITRQTKRCASFSASTHRHTTHNAHFQCDATYPSSKGSRLKQSDKTAW